MSELSDAYKKISSLEETIYSIKSFLRAEKHVEAFVELQNIESYDIPQIQSCIESLEHPLYNEAINYIIEEGCPDLNKCICSYLCEDPIENGRCKKYCAEDGSNSINKWCIERFFKKRIADREHKELMEKFKSND